MWSPALVCNVDPWLRSIKTFVFLRLALGGLLVVAVRPALQNDGPFWQNALELVMDMWPVIYSSLSQRKTDPLPVSGDSSGMLEEFVEFNANPPAIKFRWFPYFYIWLINKIFKYNS